MSNDYQCGLLEAFEAMLDILRDETPGSCVMVWDGKDFDAIPGPSPDALLLVPGGQLNDYAFTLQARKTDFATLPLSGDRMAYKGKTSRILTVDAPDVSSIVQFHCGTPDK